jgi:MFS family permease
MTDRIVQKLRDSKGARWSVLLLVSLAMMSGYIITDVVAPLKTMLEQAPTLWSSTDYGIFTSGYGWLNIFLLMLIFGGMILDRMGIRFTGTLAIAIMIAGTAIKYWAITTTFDNPVVHLPFGLDFNRQVLYAALGFAVFGTGVEMVGITANKAVVKWFRGKEMAMAIGMNTAFGRIGTLIALNLSPKIAIHFGSVGAPIAFGLGLLALGLCTFLVYCVMDRKLDKQDSEAGLEPDEPFRFSDIGRIASNSGFWLITILCILFYSAVFPYLKFAPDFMFQKFGIPLEKAGEIPSLLPLGTLFLTPLFGYIYDRRGRGATIMIIGAVLLVIVHALFSVPAFDAAWMAVGLTILLGIAFSLVPSAMWPSVAKIMPHNMLGTAYSMIFWVQNIGLSFVPMLIGWVLNKYCLTGQVEVDGVMTPTYDYTIPMMIFAAFGVLSILFALWLKHDDARKRYGLEQPNIKK